ncbi:uncharacterized protein TNCV_509501 [Trichonephila clavipes]|nr:uncharacterized protein TNCV_509501 [Trichonephila clavipes]
MPMILPSQTATAFHIVFENGCRPTGIVVSDADCCAVGTGFESRRRHGCLRHGGTLNSRRAVSPLESLVEGEERWEAPDHPQGDLPQNWGETELNRSVTCILLKATVNDRRHSAFWHDEFREP